MKRLKQHVPLVTDKVDRVIADGLFNMKTNSDFVRDEIGAVLYTPINPKNINVPSAMGIKGIDHFTKNGSAKGGMIKIIKVDYCVEYFQNFSWLRP